MTARRRLTRRHARGISPPAALNRAPGLPRPLCPAPATPPNAASTPMKAARRPAHTLSTYPHPNRYPRRAAAAPRPHRSHPEDVRVTRVRLSAGRNQTTTSCAEPGIARRVPREPRPFPADT